MIRSRTALVALCVGIAGCGGGGSQPPAPALAPVATATASTVAPVANGPFVAGTIDLVIANPPAAATSSSKRRAAFISPSAYSVGVSINGMTPTYADVSVYSSGCTTIPGTPSSRSCPINVLAPAGSDTFTLMFYNGANGAGTLLGQGSGTTTVALGTPFNLAISVNPFVGSLTSPIVTYASGSSFVRGTAGTATVAFTMLDPASATIPASPAATFATPITFTSSDPSVTVAPSPWTTSAQSVTITYSGATTVVAPVTITASAGTTTVGSFQVFTPVVSTLAGSASSGFQDGTGSAALFSGALGIAVDGSGNVVVADTNNNRIRSVTPAGVVTTLAGSTSGLLDGPGATALFRSPWGIATAPNGNLYVADANNNAIRVISSGSVATLTSSTQGYVDGPVASSEFRAPFGVAIDAQGNVFVADALNYKVREISAAGIVSTLAGTTQGYTDGPGTSAQFGLIQGIAVDASDNVYVADQNNYAIRKITPAGVVSTLAGGGTHAFTDGTGTAAHFYDPYSLAIAPNGTLYVGDSDRIRAVTPAGVVTTFAGSAAGHLDGPLSSATFFFVSAIAIDATGNIYVDDVGQLIRKITVP